MTHAVEQTRFKLLLDTCVWGGAQQELKAAGYDVIWIGDWSKDPGDEEILALAYAEDRIVVTLDKDFGELAVVWGKPHHGIIRLVSICARQQAQYCLSVLNRYCQELRNGAILTVRSDRIRIRSSEQ